MIRTYIRKPTLNNVGRGCAAPNPSARKASRLEDRKRCWPALGRAAVHKAVHRVCISFDTCVEWVVENLWIKTRRCDIPADKGHTRPVHWCGEESLRRVAAGYCAGRVGFQPYFRRVTRGLRDPLGNPIQIVRQADPRRPSTAEPRGVGAARQNPAAADLRQPPDVDKRC
jgi:hypothetical protein